MEKLDFQAIVDSKLKFHWNDHIAIFNDFEEVRNRNIAEVLVEGFLVAVVTHGQAQISVDDRTYQLTTGDVITCNMAMEARLIEANPLVEEARGQVAVQRGPIVYCAESADLGGADIDDLLIPVTTQFKPVETTLAGSRMMALEGEVLVRGNESWTGTLYREASAQKQRKTIRLIPYYAWGNRGKSEMTVWMPVAY